LSRLAPRPLSLALDGFSRRLAPATMLARAQEAWPRAAGPAIAAAARPVAERDGVLTISCEAAVWAQELALMETALLDSLNAQLGAGAVCRLRCRTG
jgi:predicted nucleic acid-binding Zn ribbon protein